MSDDRRGQAGAAIRLANGDRCQELRKTAIAREVVDVDLGTAAAVVTVVRCQELPPLVHFQRLPRIEHRCGGQIAGRRRIACVGDIDDRHSEMRPIGGAERCAVISADAMCAFGKFGGLPVGAVAAALSDKLQIAVEPMKSRGT